MVLLLFLLTLGIKGLIIESLPSQHSVVINCQPCCAVIAWGQVATLYVEDAPQVEFMYLVFTRMPGESCCRRLRSLLYLCYVFPALINSLVCWFFTLRQRFESRSHIPSSKANPVQNYQMSRFKSLKLEQDIALCTWPTAFWNFNNTNTNILFYIEPQQQLYELLALYRSTNAIEHTSICYLN